jgi:hypothetical protein
MKSGGADGSWSVSSVAPGPVIKLNTNMSTKAVAIASARSLPVNWDEEVLFTPLVLVHAQTETRLRATPVTMDFSQALIDSNDSKTEQAGARTVTGNTEFFSRETLPPAEAA